MINKIKNTIKKYELLSYEDKVLVGVSGGPDSITLLNILYELGYNLCVAHINHQIREAANDDEEFVRAFCAERQIDFFVKRVRLKELDLGMTLEETGRKIRYDFFYEIKEREGCTKIATAHNANDNAETVIMNLIRGSGMTGLKGIEVKRGDIVRPLIEVTRNEIEEYCNENNLNPCYDETNNEAIYTRNKVRLELLPYIEKNINSHVVNNINRMSSIIIDEEAFIEKVVDKAYNDCIISESFKNVVCNLSKFNKLDSVIKRRLIKRFIFKAIGTVKDIERIHVEDILKLCENNIGGKYLTPNKNIKIMVDKGKVQYIGL